MAAAHRRAIEGERQYLTLRQDPPGVPLVPAPVQGLGCDAELDDEIVGQILRLGLAALFLPQPDQRGFVAAHNNARVRAAEETASMSKIVCACVYTHGFLQHGNDVLRFGRGIGTAVQTVS